MADYKLEDPETSPEYIRNSFKSMIKSGRGLGWYRDDVERIAGNPNTPVDLLLNPSLLREASNSFVENPVLPLLQIENPTMF
jgi:hypothetical protein